jgi:hypothetical protein
LASSAIQASKRLSIGKKPIPSLHRSRPFPRILDRADLGLVAKVCDRHRMLHKGKLLAVPASNARSRCDHQNHHGILMVLLLRCGRRCRSCT